MASSRILSFFFYFSVSFVQSLSLLCPGHPPPPPSAPLANERSKTLQWLMSTKRQDPSVISPPCVFSQAANSSKTSSGFIGDGNDTVLCLFFDWAALTVWFGKEKKTVRRHSVPMKNPAWKILSFSSATMFLVLSVRSFFSSVLFALGTKSPLRH